jgi:hypothetical protein
VITARAVNSVHAEEKTVPNKEAPPSIVSQSETSSSAAVFVVQALLVQCTNLPVTIVTPTDPPVDRAAQQGVDKPVRTKKRIVILGSGWAAVGVLRELDNDAYEVRLCLELVVTQLVLTRHNTHTHTGRGRITT